MARFVRLGTELEHATVLPTYYFGQIFKAANVVLLGAISRLLDLPEELWWKCLEQRVPKKFLDLNRTAFASGRGAVG